MNKLYHLSYLLLLFLLPSCSDFLEEKSQDLIIPKTVQDYQELLFGEAYLRDNTTVHVWLDVMTDDVKENIRGSFFGSDTRVSAWGHYTWQPEVEVTAAGKLVADNSWDTYYHSILLCNVCLDGMGDITGTQADKEDLKAEAHALRAYCYFMLVNLYGKPYVPETADTDPGVPVNDVTGMEDRQFQRESVGRIYSLIEEDLAAAIAGFQASGKKKDFFRWNLPAAYLLASRVSLYKKEYAEAADFATKAIALKPQLYNLANKSEEDCFLNLKNPEILLTYGYYHVPFYALLAKCNFPMSGELERLYGGKNDLRLSHFFAKRRSNYLAAKNDDAGFSGVYGFALRTAEAYLNRAEAYAESGEVALAMQDINTLRKNRLNVYTELTATDAADAVRLVREERRREFCFEFHRWFDLRRWDRPEIVHYYTRDPKNPGVVEKYVLEKDDPAYTLPIPMSVMDYDSGLEDIERPERPDLNAMDEEESQPLKQAES